MKLIWGFTGRAATPEQIYTCVGPGWHSLLERLLKDLESLGWDGTVMQVKEKFGGLRFYIGDASDAVRERIAQAEHESYATCEKCGELGGPTKDGWIRVLCEACHLLQQELRKSSSAPRAPRRDETTREV